MGLRSLLQNTFSSSVIISIFKASGLVFLINSTFEVSPEYLNAISFLAAFLVRLTAVTDFNEGEAESPTVSA